MAADTLGDFVAAVARSAGLPASKLTVGFLAAMAQAEGGHFSNSCTYNPLNTTKKVGGSKACTGSVQAYPSFAVGVAATADTLKLSNYAAVRGALSRGDLAGAAAALQKSGWCGGPSAPCPGYGAKVKGLYPATAHAARSMGAKSSGGSATGSKKSTGGATGGCSTQTAALLDSRLARAASYGEIQHENISAADVARYRAGQEKDTTKDWQTALADISRAIAADLVAKCGVASLQEAYKRSDAAVAKSFATGNANGVWDWEGTEGAILPGGIMENIGTYLKIVAGAALLIGGGIVIIVGLSGGGSAVAQVLPGPARRVASGSGSNGSADPVDTELAELSTGSAQPLGDLAAMRRRADAEAALAARADREAVSERRLALAESRERTSRSKLAGRLREERRQNADDREIAEAMDSLPTQERTRARAGLPANGRRGRVAADSLPGIRSRGFGIDAAKIGA